jgi:hypothetical protein
MERFQLWEKLQERREMEGGWEETDEKTTLPFVVPSFVNMSALQGPCMGWSFSKISSSPFSFSGLDLAQDSNRSFLVFCTVRSLNCPFKAVPEVGARHSLHTRSLLLLCLFSQNYFLGPAKSDTMCSRPGIHSGNLTALAFLCSGGF